MYGAYLPCAQVRVIWGYLGIMSMKMEATNLGFCVYRIGFGDMQNHLRSGGWNIRP